MTAGFPAVIFFATYKGFFSASLTTVSHLVSYLGTMLFLYPPLLVLFTAQIGLNFLGRRWLGASRHSPALIWWLSWIGMYLIAKDLVPEPLPTGEYRCGLFMVFIIWVGVYGAIINSLIYFIFRRIQTFIN